jgi:transposase-like protein
MSSCVEPVSPQEEIVMGQRKRHTSQLKTKVALEALKERKTTAQIASQFEVHAAQVSQWKKQAMEILGEGFKSPSARKADNEFSEDMLYSQIGQLKVELDWLKKKSGLSS